MKLLISAIIIIVSTVIIPISSVRALSAGSTIGNTACIPTGTPFNISASATTTLGIDSSGTYFYMQRLAEISNAPGSYVGPYPQFWYFQAGGALAVFVNGTSVSGTWTGSFTPAFGGYSIYVSYSLPGCTPTIILQGTTYYMGN
jgi:hypothetical protein